MTCTFLTIPLSLLKITGIYTQNMGFTLFWHELSFGAVVFLNVFRIVAEGMRSFDRRLRQIARPVFPGKVHTSSPP